MVIGFNPLKGFYWVSTFIYNLIPPRKSGRFQSLEGILLGFNLLLTLLEALLMRFNPLKGFYWVSTHGKLTVFAQEELIVSIP